MQLGKKSSNLQWLSIGLLLLAIILLTIQLIVFSRSRLTYPDGLAIGGVPVGGLDRQEATERLLEVFNTPIELSYNENIIQLTPGVVGFKLNLESMISSADNVTRGGPFWDEYWGFLWSNQTIPQPIPLDADYSESQLRTYLANEIAARYDKPAEIPNPIVGTSNWEGGLPGTTIDIDIAIIQIENAFRSPTNRQVSLPLKQTAPGRSSFQNLEIFLKQTIDNTGFDGIAGIYLLDLQNFQEIHFVYQNGVNLENPTDIAFTAVSIIKIPIMISAFVRLEEPMPQEAENLLSGMILESGNDSADWLMEQYIDPGRGPLVVTDDLQKLGFENTFLAGLFRLGSALLFRYQTPANTRTDISMTLDPYNQTTPSEIGTLLSDIYQCSKTGGGALVAVFPDQITQTECQTMIDLLSRVKLGSLLEAGSPEGAQIARKYGFLPLGDGGTILIADTGIVYTPSGDYVLVMFFYHPIQLVWDPTSTLIGDLAKIIYNYYNISR